MGKVAWSFIFLSLAAVCAVTVTAWDPGLTRGQVWPLPRYVSTLKTFLNIDPALFTFKITRQSCGILKEAVKRYGDVVRQTSILQERINDDCTSQVSHTLSEVEVQLTSPCEEWPYAGMDEHYEIHVDTQGHLGSGVITSSSIWGVLRGLETFSQLVTPSSDSDCLRINSTDILDYPRFTHRGLLLDTSRHYLPVSIIYNILSAMEMNKMNVFHWHIVDDQSFPYQSVAFPTLSENGAYDAKRLIYSQDTVRKIIEYAKLRGIRVIPEFDSPGHTQSWGKGVDKLLTPCFTDQTFNGNYGPVDPSRRQNYKFIKTLFREVKNLFPDKYIHIGGDEVNYTCWMSNPAIKAFMVLHNIATYEGLEGFYIGEVLSIIRSLNVKGIVWQEVFQHSENLPTDTVVHVWYGNRTELLYNITNAGNQALLSQDWYLDHLIKNWEDYYTVDPTDFGGTKKQEALVLGGEACMWGEMADETNIVPRIWPRASAVAERLWSGKDVNSISAAERRLNKHVCRMRRRGVFAEPANGPGFCPY